MKELHFESMFIVQFVHKSNKLSLVPNKHSQLYDKFIITVL